MSCGVRASRVFSSEPSVCIRWPKYWSWSFSISPPKEYAGLISFRIDWFDLLDVQGTLKSLLWYHNSKASILQCLAFFMVQLSNPYMIPRKIIALTIWTIVGKVMSLLCNTLSRFVIAFLPRSKYLNFVAAVTICCDFESWEKKICHCFHFCSIYLPWSDGTSFAYMSHYFFNISWYLNLSSTTSQSSHIISARITDYRF